MCCPGCQAVARLISGSGLESFYHLRDGFNQRPEDEAGTVGYDIYDEPSNSEDFVQQLDAGQRQARLLLGGVSCAACTWLIETALLRNPAIHRASVNLAQQSLSLQWDSNGLKLSEIFSQLKGLGYEPYPWQANVGAELIQQQQRQALQQLAVAGLAMMQVGMFSIALHAGDLQGMDLQYRGLLRWVSLIVSSIVVFFSARSFFSNAWLNLRQGRLVMDTPVALAIGLAYTASAYATVRNEGQVYFDSVAMFTFFLLLGRFLERRVRRKNLLRQTDLKSLLPASCQRLSNGQWTGIACREIAAGDILLLQCGSVIPTDGVLIEGLASVDEATFSGEHLPHSVAVGDLLTAGTLLVDGQVQMRATTDIGHTRIAALMRVIDRAELDKPRLARLADRVAARFIGLILMITAGVAIYWWQVDPQQTLWVCLSVLVVSCPCALALATPAALTNAASALRQRGLLLGGENILEQLNKCSTVVFDKTGTLTSGNIYLKKTVVCGSLNVDECIGLAHALEQYSNHPIGKAFTGATSSASLSAATNIPGRGVLGRLRGLDYAIGTAEFVRELNPSLGTPPTTAGLWIALSSSQQQLAWFQLGDKLRAEAGDVVLQLKSRGLRVELLSGDHSEEVSALATALQMDRYHGACSPQQKLDYIQSLQDAGETVMMVGDGLNDAAVLAAADCSFAVNSATDLAKSRADAILLKPQLTLLLAALHTAAKCRRIIAQNIGWALGYNALAVPLAATGLVPPWAAAIGMSLSSLLVVTNSLRLNHPHG